MGNMLKTNGQMRSNDDAEPAPWELQPWDTGVSFDRFRNFYLTQEVPRSLVKVYRRYRRSRGASEEDVQRIRAAPGTWKHWAYGQDSKGRPIPHSLTWAERARAYDVDLADRHLRDEEEKWQERRNQLREADWKAGELLRARAERMQLGLLFRKETTETTGADGTKVTKIVYEPTNWSERDIAAAFRLASDLQRRGAGEPPNNPVSKGGWREQAKQAGFDPDELREQLNRMLMGAFDTQEKYDEI